MNQTEVKNISLAGTGDTYKIQIGDIKPDWVINYDDPHFENQSIEMHNGIKYLVFDDQYYITKNSVTNYRRTVKKAVTMLGVEECSKILLDFNPLFHFLRIHEIFAIREDELINKLPSADFQILRREYHAEKNIFSGNATLSVILEDIKIYDTVGISYSLTSTNVFETEYFNRLFNLEYFVQILAFNLTVISENEINLEYKFLDEKFDLKHIILQNKEIFSISQVNTSAIKPVEFQPPWYRPVSYWQIGIKKTWNEIALSQAAHYGNFKITSNTLLSFVNELRNNYSADESIVLSILHFLHKNVRYFSNSKITDSVIPGSPDAVIKRGYGDCKDFVNLLHCLLLKFNIITYPVLVHSRIGKGLLDSLPSAMIFDHAILLIKINDENYFIDPTIGQGITELKDIYLPDYGYGLICNQTSTELTKINNSFASCDAVKVLDEYNTIDWENHTFNYRSTVTLKGSGAFRLIQFIANTPEEKVIQVLKEPYLKYHRVIKEIGHEIDLSRISKNEVTFSLKFIISLRFFYKNKKESVCEFLPIDIAEAFNQTLPNKIETDFYFGSSISINYIIELSNAKGFFESKNQIEIVDDAFMFLKKSMVIKNKFIFQYLCKKLEVVVENERYEEFLEKFIQVKKTLPGVIKAKLRKKFHFGYILSPVRYLILMILFSTLLSSLHNFFSN